MQQIQGYLRRKPIVIMLIFFPLAIISEFTHMGAIWVFAFSSLAIIPFAGFIGESTEVLAHHTNPRIGGLLNATLGNAAELIITIVAIRAGLLDLVKASITGSILGNLLLVLGMAMFLGGIRHGVQKFDRRQASQNGILLLLSVIILLIPSLLSHYIGDISHYDPKVETLSLGVAIVMIMIYALGLIYSFKAVEGPTPVDNENEHSTLQTNWSIRTALIVLGLATAGVAYLSEVLVGAIEPLVTTFGISEFFIGIIFIPLIGNVAEHMVAVQVAVKNKMSLSVEIAVASSLQIALFVAPVLVFISLLLGNPLTLIFNQFELLALIAGVLITVFVSEDGESNWLEGAELLAIYFILGLAFFLLPK